MKILLLVVLSLSSVIYAQDYLPFPAENVSWSNAQYIVVDDDGFYYYELESLRYFCGTGEDTTISEQDYKVIEICGGEYTGAIRDEEGMVYFAPKDSLSEFLIYDFTAEVGDTIFDVYYGDFGDGGFNDFIVSSISTIEIGGVTRRVISPDAGFSWVEGIGCEKGFLKDHLEEASEYGHNLYCMSIGDTTFYSENDGGLVYEPGSCSLSVGIDEDSESSPISVHPNPSSDLVYFDFSTETKIDAVTVTSLDGKSFPIQWTSSNNSIIFSVNELPKGLYIVTLLGKDVLYRKSILVQ